jgi:peptidoglycan hydrolase-like protein with peptidoglycan-binding domain
VKLLQEKLNENGAKLGIDGIFGLGTQAAVMNFQALHNLAVDGIAGKRTLTALGI